MYYLGIDWANDKHDLCLLDEAGTILKQMTIPQDLTGFQQLERLVNRYGVDKIRLNIERSDGLLVDWIMAQRWPLYITPTVVVAHRRPRRSKSDVSDAYLLAHLLRLNDPDCRQLTRSSATVLHLRELARALETALADQRRLANRLRYTLLQYFPAATKIFHRVEYLVTLAFLEQYPTPEAAQTLTPTSLQLFLKQHHYHHYSRVDEILALLNAPMPRAMVPEGYIAQVQMLIPLLRELYQRVIKLEKGLVAVLDTHPEAAWWRSWPGTHGPLTLARLLAWIGDDRTRFPTAASLQAVAGTAPVTRRSGKSLSVEFRYACSHPLRKAMDDFSRQSVRHSAWAREYLKQQVARGHNKARAYRALANRWMKIIWTLWQRQELYNEARHEANRTHQQKNVRSRAG
jgi:transposase